MAKAAAWADERHPHVNLPLKPSLRVPSVGGSFRLWVDRFVDATRIIQAFTARKDGMLMQEKLSAFVISYNRASLLDTCLRAVSFADELIVVDKSSTDDSAAVAARHADRVEIVPWSPTVEETRAFAASLCRHEWVLCLDDDEILSSVTGSWLMHNLPHWDIDIVAIPLRHYILGVHDERAYYWPEEHYRLFRKGAIEFIPVVHGGMALQSDRIASIPAASGVCIHHLSYQDVASWIERTNRYTSRPDRVRAKDQNGNLIRFAHDQIEYWIQRSDDPSGNDYPTAVALLRAIYDVVDRLKAWESERGEDGATMLRIAQQQLVAAVNEQATPIRARKFVANASTDLPPTRPAAAEHQMELQQMRVALRAIEAQLRERTAAERKAILSLADVRNELDATIATLAATQRDLGANQALLNRTLNLLDQERTTLSETQAVLDRTRFDLANTSRELEQLGNSGRVFLRQYLPKLGRHLLRQLRLQTA